MAGVAPAGMKTRASACQQCVERCRNEHGTGDISSITKKINPAAIPARHPCFIKTLLENGFRSWMQIPKVFVKRHGETFRGCSSVDLVGANGKTWLVDVHSPAPNVAVFKLGWKVFATDNQLKAGDSVLFTLVSKSRFTVHIFNRLGVESTNWSSTDATSLEFNIPNLHSSPVNVGDLGDEGAESEESDTSESDNPQTGFKFPSDTYTDAGSSCVKNNTVDAPGSTEPYGPSIRDILQGYGYKRAQPSTPKVQAMANPKLSHHIGHLGHRKRPAPAMMYNEEQGLWQVESGWNSRTYESIRRAVTDEERKRAKTNALEYRTKHPSVGVLMRPSHVYRGHWLTIPSDFAKVHLPLERCQIILQDEYECQWQANWVVSKQHSGISGGWAAFSLDHRLEEGDVCVFEVLDSNHQDCITIVVHIFRVVEIDLEPGTRGGWSEAYKLVHGQGLLRQRKTAAADTPQDMMETTTEFDHTEDSSPRKRKSCLARTLHTEILNGQFSKRSREESKSAQKNGDTLLQTYHQLDEVNLNPKLTEENETDTKPRVRARSPGSNDTSSFTSDSLDDLACKGRRMHTDVKPTLDELQAALKLEKLAHLKTAPPPDSVRVKTEVTETVDEKPTSRIPRNPVTPAQKLQCANEELEGDINNELEVSPNPWRKAADGVDGDGGGSERTWYTVSRLVDKRQSQNGEEKEFLVELVEELLPLTQKDMMNNSNSSELMEDGLQWIPNSHFSHDFSSCYLPTEASEQTRILQKPHHCMRRL